MSCVSRRVSIRFILGCGSSSENASISGLRPNFLAMTSNGGASATCLSWSGSMAWHGTQRACARRLPLSTSAASAAGASRIVGSSKQNRSDRIIPAPAFCPPVRTYIPYRVLPRSAHWTKWLGPVTGCGHRGDRKCRGTPKRAGGHDHAFRQRGSMLAAVKRRYKSRCLASGHQSYKKISIGFQFATQPTMMMPLTFPVPSPATPERAAAV